MLKTLYVRKCCEVLLLCLAFQSGGVLWGFAWVLGFFFVVSSEGEQVLILHQLNVHELAQQSIFTCDILRAKAS